MPPSEVPVPASQGQVTESPTSPITIGSAEEENVGSRNNATEPSDDETPSMSEGDKTQEGRIEQERQRDETDGRQPHWQSQWPLRKGWTRK